MTTGLTTSLASKRGVAALIATALMLSALVVALVPQGASAHTVNNWITTSTGSCGYEYYSNHTRFWTEKSWGSCTGHAGVAGRTTGYYGGVKPWRNSATGRAEYNLAGENQVTDYSVHRRCQSCDATWVDH
jgi:hypothetical protein